MTELHPEHHAEDSRLTAHEGANVNTTRIEISERTLSILALAFSCVAIMGSFWAITEAQKSERESRILQQQVMDQSALLLREGLRDPSDFSNGPAYTPKEKRK